MVPIRLPISKSSTLFNKPLVNIPKAPVTIGKIVTFVFHFFFLFHSKVEVLILLFTFFQFYSVGRGTVKSIILRDFFVVVDYYKVWSSGRDKVIRLYVKIPLEFMCVIL